MTDLEWLEYCEKSLLQGLYIFLFHKCKNIFVNFGCVIYWKVPLYLNHFGSLNQDYKNILFIFYKSVQGDPQQRKYLCTVSSDPFLLITVSPGLIAIFHDSHREEKLKIKLGINFSPNFQNIFSHISPERKNYLHISYFYGTFENLQLKKTSFRISFNPFLDLKYNCWGLSVSVD